MPKYIPSPELINRLAPIEFMFCGKEFVIQRITQEFTDRLAELEKSDGPTRVTDILKIMIDSAEGPDFSEVAEFDVREAKPLVDWFYQNAFVVPEKEKNAGETSEVSP